VPRQHSQPRPLWRDSRHRRMRSSSTSLVVYGLVVIVTVPEALVLRLLLDDRWRITESIRILVPVNRMKQKCFQITTKQVGRSQLLSVVLCCEWRVTVVYSASWQRLRRTWKTIWRRSLSTRSVWSLIHGTAVHLHRGQLSSPLRTVSIPHSMSVSLSVCFLSLFPP